MNFHFSWSIDGSGLRSRLETVHLSVTYQSAVVHTENSSPTRLTSFTTRSSIKLATINEFDLMPQTFQQRWIFYNVFVKLWKFRSMFPSLFLQLTLSQRQPWTTAWQFGCTLCSLVSLVPEYGIIMSMFDKLFSTYIPVFLRMKWNDPRIAHFGDKELTVHPDLLNTRSEWVLIQLIFWATVLW